MRVRLAIGLLIAGLALPQLAHAHERDAGLSLTDLQRVYAALVRSTQQARLQETCANGSSRPCLRYGNNERIFLNDDAFSQIVRDAIPIFEAEAQRSCPDCDSESLALIRKTFTEKLRAGLVRARTYGVQVSGWALEMAKLYGPSWVIYTLVVEITEHSLLWWLPPGSPTCTLLQIPYFLTAGLIKHSYGYLTNQIVPATFTERLSKILSAPWREWRFRKKLQTVFATDTDAGEQRRTYLARLTRDRSPLEPAFAETAFWGEVFHHFDTFDVGKDEPVSLTPTLPSDDIEFIFSDAAPELRHWRAFRHVKGLELMRDLLREIVEHSLVEGKVQASHYTKAKKALGTLGALLSEYKNDLVFVASTPRGNRDWNPSSAAVSQTLTQILESLERFPETLRAPPEEMDALRARLEAIRLFQREIRKGRPPSPPVPQSCAEKISKAASTQ